MSVKDIIKIALALVFISLLLWLIFSEDTTLNGNEDGIDLDEVPDGAGIGRDRDGLVVYKTVDKT